ncbi:uncharacterized protein LOC132257801 [Phlebotomus argentipes]|uniref:uncharacterized protein LOC132257801 n=1 Tax=Phlebotomus argentipes TaxID=94469 RepID=UPI002892BAF8|nr:uncharacterized protein LOC132257801 [Phlebotomus argentipes]
MDKQDHNEPVGSELSGAIGVNESVLQEESTIRPQTELLAVEVSTVNHWKILIYEMIAEEVQAFERDLKNFQLSQNIDTQIESQEISGSCSEQLQALKDWSVQEMRGIESLAESVTNLTLSLSEAFDLILRAKRDRNAAERLGIDRVKEEMKCKVRDMLTRNLQDLEDFELAVDTRWKWQKIEQEMKKDGTKLENVNLDNSSIENMYKRINIMRPIIMNQRKKINELKKILKVRVTRNSSVQELDLWPDFDALLLTEPFEYETRQLSASKMNKLYTILKDRPIRLIHPARPDRKDMSDMLVRKDREIEAKAKNLQAKAHKSDRKIFCFGPKITETPVSSQAFSFSFGSIEPCMFNFGSSTKFTTATVGATTTTTSVSSLPQHFSSFAKFATTSAGSSSTATWSSKNPSTSGTRISGASNDGYVFNDLEKKPRVADVVKKKKSKAKSSTQRENFATDARI